MYKIIAIKRKTGEYKEKPYDNFMIGAIDYETTVSSVVLGGDCTIEKVKSSVFTHEIERLKADSSAADWFDGSYACLLNRSISFGYDKWQNVIDITIS